MVTPMIGNTASPARQDADDRAFIDSHECVLIVDDEATICWAIQRALTKLGLIVVTASSAEEGLEIASQRPIALVFLDVRLPREDGLTALPRFLELTENSPVVIMTAFGDLSTAVHAVEQGAADYITKPFKLEDIETACRAHLNFVRDKPLKPNPSPLSSKDAQPQRSENPRDAIALVGQSAAMQSVFRQIAFFANSELSVLITGETGTGKELVANAIHRHSSRSDRPYLAVAPVAMNPDLIESELFGHVRGAFTGAEADRVGLFEAAEGGTILLDEIGDLPPNLQVKLLRVLEQGEYCRVGEATPRKCDVRVLAATHCDLRERMSEGRFREDLFYRLNGMHIHLPPLRDRVDDFRPFCEHFLRDLPTLVHRHIDDEVLAYLVTLDWPGNIRQLRNAVQHAAVLARGRPIQISDFPDTSPAAANSATRSSEGNADILKEAVIQWANEYIQQNPGCADLHTAFLAVAEAELMRFACSASNGNRAKAAELLGIHRGTLRERLRLYGIE